MPRTTVDLEDSLIRTIKHLAAESRESMSQAINRLLLAGIANEQKGRKRRSPIKWQVAGGTRPAPGFDPANRDYLDSLTDEP
jgi:hypothetical protein